MYCVQPISSERPLEKSLEDRLLSFHLNESCSEESKTQQDVDDEEDDDACFAGVRVLSPIADELLARCV